MTARDIALAASLIHDLHERSTFVDRICAGDATLRRQVEELHLAAPCGHAGAGASPSAETADTTVTGQLPAQPRLDGLLLAPGMRLGPYELLRELGAGGMGRVFEAQQHEPVQRRVALKVITGGRDSEQLLARFAQERQALALMDHDHIAKVFDAGTTAAG
jgi:serine/threonine protein kinase